MEEVGEIFRNGALEGLDLMGEGVFDDEKVSM